MTATAAPTRPRGGRQSHLRPGGRAWLAPGFVLSVGLIYYSIFYSGFLSFFSWRGGTSKMTFVGFDNYVEAFTNPWFWGAIWHTLVFFVVVFVVQVVGG